MGFASIMKMWVDEVGWRGQWGGGGGGGVVFGFPLMAATLHRRGKDPLELVCRRHRSYHS